MNACHSEKLAESFIANSRVNYAIAVLATERIEDKAAIVFSEQFYSFLLEGCSVARAFEMAQNHTRTECDWSVCCCAHSHEPGCLFRRLEEREGRQAHATYHKLGSNCKCIERLKNNHSSSCRWAIQALRAINAHYCGYQDFEFMRFERLHVCCCCTMDCYKIHDQSIKFSLITRPGLNPSEPVFNPPAAKQPGFSENTVEGLREWIYRGQTLIGRNLEIYRLVTCLADREKYRTVILSGPSGIGKTSLSKRAVSYLIERGHYQDIFFYTNLDEVRTIY